MASRIIDPVDGTEKMYTWIRTYSLQGIKCPAGMNEANCPLRKKIANLINKENETVLPNGDLLIPCIHYDEMTDGSINFHELQIELCDACFKAAAARSK